MVEVDVNTDSRLLQIIDMCKELHRIPTNKEVAAKQVGSSKTINNICQQYGYKNKLDFCRQHGYGLPSDISINGILKPQNQITLADLKILWLDFKQQYGRFPNACDCNARRQHSYNLPHWDNVLRIMLDNNIILDEFFEQVGDNTLTVTKTRDYDYYVEKYIRISRERGKFLNSKELVSNPYRLPSSRWFVKNCPDASVRNFNQFVEWCGFIPTYNASKAKVTEIIYEMQSNLNRPLMYDDFRNPSPDGIGMGYINKYWGSLNKMKTALGLQIVQKDMISKHKSPDELLDLLQQYISKLGRLPLCREIDQNANMPNSGVYHRYFNGLNNAFILLGYTPNKKSIAIYLSDDEVRQIYLDYINDLGFVPTCDFCKSVYELPSPRTVMRRFNCSWNEFIISLGFTPNEQMPVNPTYAIDGTLCLSASECLVHNYLLSKKGIRIHKEVLYRDFLRNELLQEQAGLRRCDWILHTNNNFYIIEYFGMMGIRSYDQRHDYKINLIKQDGLNQNFIAIYPEDINELDSVFSFL